MKFEKYRAISRCDNCGADVYIEGREYSVDTEIYNTPDKLFQKLYMNLYNARLRSSDDEYNICHCCNGEGDTSVMGILSIIRFEKVEGTE